MSMEKSHCFECGATKNLIKHHVVPKSKGGTKTLRLCQRCHDLVHGIEPRDNHMINLALLSRINLAKEGKPWGSNLPFGRNYDKATGWTVSQRGLRLRALLKRYVEGESLSDLLKYFKEFSSTHVVLSAVRTSQLSGIYVKKFHVPDLNIHELKIPIPAIPEVITPELERRVLARMKHCRSWTRESLKAYQLTGFVRCGHCGKSLSGQSQKGIKYYRHLSPCAFHSIPEDQLIAPALDRLYSFFADEPGAGMEEQRDWRQQDFDEIKRFLIFLFSEDPSQSGMGIIVTKDNSCWRLNFKTAI